MKSIYETFEFDYIKDELKKYVHHSLAKKYVESLVMFDSYDQVEDELNYVKEAFYYSYKYSSLTVFSLEDLMDELINIHKGGRGTIHFFISLSYSLDNIKLIKEEFKEENNCPLLASLVNLLNLLPSLKSSLERVFSKDGEIVSSASPNLLRIRNRISSLENSISSLIHSLIDKYRNYLTDYQPSLKGNVYTLMVKSSFKNRISGIVISQSDSGNTFFIEPQELINVYNEISSLKEEEKAEIDKILLDLSKKVLLSENEVRINNFSLARIDFLFAKASLGIAYKGNIVTLNKQGIISLSRCAHPLIDAKKVVRNSFYLTSQKMMIITGPNAGGKTVCLKLIGLMVIMNQCGLILPIEKEGTLPYFKNIYALIGDEQSLIDNLSTFSSHIVGLENIVSKVDDASLVIIDELGTGTSPLEGEALAVSIINYLLNKKCYSFISSHYDGVKNLALMNDKILCASMVFDEERLMPTYHLILNVASPSYGIDVARRLGLEEDIIIKAKEYLEEKKSSSKDILLDELNQKLAIVDDLKNTLESEKKNLESINQDLKNQIERTKKERINILKQAEDEKQELILKAKEEIDQLYDQFKKNQNLKMHEVISLKKKIDDQVIDYEDENISYDQISLNDYVELLDTKVRGKVISLKKGRVTVLTDSNMTIETKANKVKKVQKVKEKKATRNVDFIANLKKVPTELNLIGLTVKEALPILEKYLDDALSVHYKQVRIITGSGTGKLREGVHQYLRKSSYVDSFRLGGENEGYVGATVVYLK